LPPSFFIKNSSLRCRKQKRTKERRRRREKKKEKKKNCYAAYRRSFPFSCSLDFSPSSHSAAACCCRCVINEKNSSCSCAALTVLLSFHPPTSSVETRPCGGIVVSIGQHLSVMFQFRSTENIEKSGVRPSNSNDVVNVSFQILVVSHRTFV
jgi:hypothetical protein